VHDAAKSSLQNVKIALEMSKFRG